MQRQFDGIICIGGEDWWYHNRGHFDFQIMRRLARSYPVLFVNSLGVRLPSAREGRKFVARIGRKLRSLRNGLVRVESDFWVFSPVMVPGSAGMKLSSWALAPQIRLAAANAGISKPLLWVHCPAGAALIDQIDATAIVLQRTDRFEAFPEASSALVASQIAELKRRADLVVYSAEHLMQEERFAVRRSLLVTHGADLEMFSAAGARKSNGPLDMARLRRPRVGFIGGIDAHTFDPALFNGVVERLPDMDFAMVGGCSLPEGWCPHANVHLLGRKPYDQVAQYMAACDVLIMPWNDSDWIKACNPIKLKEYLAVGRPVVTTDFPALDGLRDLVSVAATADTFAAAIRRSLQEPVDRARFLKRLEGESWDEKSRLVTAKLEELVRSHRPGNQASTAA